MRTRLLVLLVVLATLLGACREADPETQLADAVDRTLDGAFTYEISLEADEGGDAGPGGQTGALLRGLLVSGSRDGDAWSLGVAVLGFEVIDVRVEDPDLRHFRLGLAEILGLFGGPDADLSGQVAAELRDRGEDEEIVEVARAALDGDWITVEGPLSGEELARALGDAGDGAAGDPASVAQVLGQDVREFVDRYVIVLDRREDSDRTVYDVEVDTQALAQALADADPDDPDDLADIDDRYPGTVVVRDGVVHEVELRVGGEAQSSQLRIRAVLDDHGDVPEVDQPEQGRTVSSDRFLEAVEALSALFSESPPQLP